MKNPQKPHRIQGCHIWRRDAAGPVDLVHNPDLNKAWYGNLQTCGSVWACPVCAAKITERRRVELAAAVASWRAGGGLVFMVTYTLRHSLRDGLKTLLGGQQKGSRKRGDFVPASGLMGARGAALAGRAGQQVYQDHEVSGSVRCLEVTWGENGWHPHIHELLFVAAGCDRAALLAALRVQWDKGLALAGARDVNAHGVEVSDTYEAIEEYITKFGHEPAWTVAHEMTKQGVKVGRVKGKTPMQLLADYCFDNDAEAGKHWQEYASVMEGRRLLYWSKGLRALVLPDAPDLTDEQVAEEERETGSVLVSLDAQWPLVVACEAQGELLNVATATNGDVAAVRAFLEELRGRVSPADLGRIHHSSDRGGRGFAELHHADRDREAADLGLLPSEYIAWRRGGIDAMAVPAPVALVLPAPGGAKAGGLRFPRRRAVPGERSYLERVQGGLEL